LPLRVTIGPKRLAAGEVEIKVRKSGEVMAVPLADAGNYIADYISGVKADGYAADYRHT